MVKATENLNDALVTDLLPAGLEIENLNLLDLSQLEGIKHRGTDTAGSQGQRLSLRFEEFRDDRYIAALPHTYSEVLLTYLVRAVTPGDYSNPCLWQKTCTGRKCAPSARTSSRASWCRGAEAQDTVVIPVHARPTGASHGQGPVVRGWTRSANIRTQQGQPAPHMYLPPHDPQFLLGPQLSVLVPAFCFDALSRLDPALQAAGAAHPAPLGRIAAAGAAALRVRAVQLQMATEELQGHCRWLLDGEEASEEQVLAAFAAADQRAQAEFRRVSLVITGKRMPSGLASAGHFKAYLGCMVSDAIALRQAAAGVAGAHHAAFGLRQRLDGLSGRRGSGPVV